MKSKGRAALQFNRPGKDTQGTKKKADAAVSAKSRGKSVVRRPWATPQFHELPKAEREIVLDRVQKEVVTPMRALPAVRAHVVVGVNSVARALERGELGVVVLASNPESQPFGHIPLTCRLRGVPVCVLHVSSKVLGKLFGLKSLAVFGIRNPALQGNGADPTAEQADGQADAKPLESTDTAGSESSEGQEEPCKLSPADRDKLESTIAFLRSKASRKAHAGGS